MKIQALIGGFFLAALVAGPAIAHPEFQRYSKEVSGRSVNCGMCHMHSDGPEGVKSGQIGSLGQEDLNALGLSRQALQPGAGLKSPILNAFGNALLNDLGKNRIGELKQRPELLAAAMAKDRDLDADGIPDVEEFLDGTHPLNSLDGRPWKLFRHNVVKNRFHLFMIALATAFGFFGLNSALAWLSSKARKEE